LDTYECDYDTHKCDLYTQELNFNTMRITLNEPTKINVRSSKNPDWVLTSGYTTRTSVILTPCVWFQHPACILNNHAWDLHIYACDFDTLRVKLLYYNIYIYKPIYRYMPSLSRNLIIIFLSIPKTKHTHHLVDLFLGSWSWSWNKKAQSTKKLRAQKSQHCNWSYWSHCNWGIWQIYLRPWKPKKNLKYWTQRS
jgi:hypothetical protein